MLISGDQPLPLPLPASPPPSARVVAFPGGSPATTQEPDHDLKQKLRTHQSRTTAPITFDAKDLPSLPGYDSISSACRYIRADGDRTARDRICDFIWQAAVNGNEAAHRWWLVYSDLTPQQRMRVSFDDVAVAANVRPSTLVSIIVTTAMDAGRDAADIVAAVTHPEIVARTVKSAKRIGGDHAEIAHKDRMTLLQKQGFAAIPRGMSVHVHANASASSNAAAASQSAPSVPSFHDDVKSIMPARQHVQQRLTAGDPSLDPIDALTLDGEIVTMPAAPSDVSR